MAIQPIQIDNILGLAEKVNEILRKVAQDAIDRPDIEKARKVTIEISLTPNMQRLGNHKRLFVDIAPEVKYSLPGEKGIATQAFVNEKTKELMVNTDSLDDPQQTTIYDLLGAATR